MAELRRREQRDGFTAQNELGGSRCLVRGFLHEVGLLVVCMCVERMCTELRDLAV
jgi:hypothetical protein